MPLKGEWANTGIPSPKGNVTGVWVGRRGNVESAVWVTDVGEVWGNSLVGSTAPLHMAGDPLVGVTGTTDGTVWVVSRLGKLLSAAFEQLGAWQERAGLAADGDVTSLATSGDGELWATTSSGQIAHFNGQAWTVDKPTDRSLRSVWIAQDGTSGWAAGDENVVLERHQGSWVSVVVPQAASWHGVFGVGTTTWLVGESGHLMRFSAGTWQSIDTGTTESLSSVWASSRFGLFAVGTGATQVHLASLADDKAAATSIGSEPHANLNAIFGVERPGNTVEFGMWTGGAPRVVYRYVFGHATICPSK
jgi:hypothetical protein